MSITSKNILLKIEKGAPFSRKFIWKDKYKEKINLTGYDFKSQFRYEYGEENILCTLTLDDGINVNSLEGEIEIIISSEVTSELNNYDSGMWSLEYRTSTEQPYKRLIKGRWTVEAEVTT